MNPRRIAVRMWSEATRSISPKRCSFWKLVTILITVSCTWVTLVIIDSSDLINVIASRFQRDTSSNSDAAPSVTANERDLSPPSPSVILQKISAPPPNIPDAMVSDYIDKTNPEGVYFKESTTDTDNTDRVEIHQSFVSRADDSMQKVLFVVDKDKHSPQAIKIARFLYEQRIEFKTVSMKKGFPSLYHSETGSPRFSLIIFEDYVTYLGMEKTIWNKLKIYCLDYFVGVLAFTRSVTANEIELFSDVGIKLQHRMKLRQMKLAVERPIWRIAKTEEVYQEPLPASDWTVFITSHETFKPVAYSTVASDWSGSTDGISRDEFGVVVAVHDVGLKDGVHRIILGNDVEFFLNDIVAMDAMNFLSGGRLGFSMERWLQVDIDDMFVGKEGIRTQVKDAEAMLASQDRIAKDVPGFKYNMGFSGGMYMEGNEQEQMGDKKIVELAPKFHWFDHMHRHLQPHLLTKAKILASMKSNRQFAQEQSIPVSSDYMVTPHHSGVYPVHDELYDAWEQLAATVPGAGRIVCTSTEEYPKQVPHWERRGFIYRGVMAMPRQSCMLYTHTIRFEDYPGGKKELDASLKGGYLFKLFLHTQVMVFMTHMSNYANDQLAQYSFEGVIAHINKWTKLKVVTKTPCEMAWKYFDIYPEETTPIWTNPCDYSKHLEIWPQEKSCTRLPKFIIVGPQKTGTTALYSFLESHPSLMTSLKDPTHFEEVQFFNGKEYANGFNWYMDRFPEPTDENTILFEKSANYFDSEMTPKRVFALLPKAKIIIILSEPGKRAYSWYYHLRSHDDETALTNTFYQVISAKEKAAKSLKDTRNRCLKPGLYAMHIKRWLEYFPSNQIFIVDGDKLVRDPVPVLNSLQKFLKLQPFIDYKTKIRFDKEKGFFCRIDTGCLSPSKGRKYPPMDQESESHLANFYKSDNAKLKALLQEMNRPWPEWLDT